MRVAMTALEKKNYQAICPFDPENKISERLLSRQSCHIDGQTERLKPAPFASPRTAYLRR
jgi:hypothetical protein